jgi:hypothetical protein
MITVQAAVLLLVVASYTHWSALSAPINLRLPPWAETTANTIRVRARTSMYYVKSMNNLGLSCTASDAAANVVNAQLAIASLAAALSRVSAGWRQCTCTGQKGKPKTMFMLASQLSALTCHQTCTKQECQYCLRHLCPCSVRSKTQQHS